MTGTVRVIGPRDPGEACVVRYTKSLFCELLLKANHLKKIRTILSSDQTQFADGVVLNEAVNPSRNRSSAIRWIENPELRTIFDPIVADVNRVNDWNLELSHAEHFQQARYTVGGKYDWHVDQHPHPHKLDGLIRKVSFTLFLDDGYAGGELDLEVGSPRLESRNVTFVNRPPGTMVFFLADIWHRVRPVSDGVRETLVGWYLGPPFI